MAWIIDKFTSRGGDTARGIAAISAAVFLLSFSDALVKFAGDGFGLAQLVFLRSLVALVLLAAGLVVFRGQAALRLRCSRWVWLRSLSLAAMWLCYYAALPSISFALAAACYYTSPVWMALMSRFFLETSMSVRDWTAIGLSVAGVVLAVDPRPDNFSPTLLLPLAAAGFYALAGIITRSRCQRDTAGTMALNLNLCLCAVAGTGLAALTLFGPLDDRSFVLRIWPTLTLNDWALIVLLGGLLTIITTLVALAYRLAPTPTIGVFDTSYLGFAALWGLVFFADVPSVQEGLGLGLIAAAAIATSRKPRSNRGG
ncbi:DMT family transporter [Fulvimarina sp. MAC8]|uniref:DMT family transporter n=1 Tax=Fulvimarina sp. MAC8 TaxID=3162874 RepID=UPI0032EAF63D